MTMADTIAVMNQGRVEQIGSPGELYDSPAATFVANFLGQSNLIRATVTGQRQDILLLDAQGIRVAMPVARSQARTREAYVGVRPEKIRISRAGTSPATAGTDGTGGTSADPPSMNGSNILPGVVTDSSYIGVSTQYLVRTAWGQELMVFSQNVGGDERLAPGEGVILHWDPAHTFALDATEAIDAGVEFDDTAERPDPVGAGS